MFSVIKLDVESGWVNATTSAVSVFNKHVATMRVELWLLINIPFYDGNGEMLKKLKAIITEAHLIHPGTVKMLLLEYDWDWIKGEAGDVPSPLIQVDTLFSKEFPELKFAIFLQIHDTDSVTHCKVPSTLNVDLTMLFFNMSISDDESSLEKNSLWHLTNCKRFLSNSENPPKLGLIPTMPGGRLPNALKQMFWWEMNNWADQEEILVAFNGKYVWDEDRQSEIRRENTSNSEKLGMSTFYWIFPVVLAIIIAIWYVCMLYECFFNVILKRWHCSIKFALVLIYLKLCCWVDIMYTL